MKNTTRISLFIICILIFGCNSNKKNPGIEESEEVLIEINSTIDLFSLMHRLAGDNQYTEMLLPAYTSKFDDNFKQFINHPAIEFVIDCKVKYQINGDAPMALAVYIGLPPDLEPLLDLSILPFELDPRWDSALISDYLKNARSFAIESNFMKFQSSQKEFQELAKANLQAMINKEYIFQWYSDFFGYDPGNFKMYLALLNGSCNYGYPVNYPDGKTEFVSLIGARFPDKNGIPTFPKDWFLPVVIHEYAHSYINPLIKSNPKEFKELGEAMLVSHREKMIERGYSVWNVIFQEYIVRACTILFLEQNGSNRKAKKNIQNDKSGGFPQIDGLVSILHNYDENRDQYLDIESFLPEIKKYFKSTLN